MPTLKVDQVAAAAYIGGFRGADQITAVAVAKRESGWRTDAANSCCVGLWQINLKAHGVGADAMKNPAENAKKAYQIFRQAGGWCTRGSAKAGTCNPWQAYSHVTAADRAQAAAGVSAFLAQMGAGRSPEDILGFSAGSAIGAVADAVGAPGDIAGALVASMKAIVEFGNRLGAWLGDYKNWIRIAMVVGGGVLILGGAAITVGKTATSFLPTGKVAKVAAKLVK